LVFQGKKRPRRATYLSPTATPWVTNVFLLFYLSPVRAAYINYTETTELHREKEKDLKECVAPVRVDLEEGMHPK